jgi:predicted cation transporter
MPLNQSSEVNQSGKSKLLLRSVYIFIIVLAIGLLIYFNFNRLYAVYIYTFKTEKFDQGDKVYASNALIDPKSKGTVAALRMIRPMTEEEIKDIIMMSSDQRVRFLKGCPKPQFKAICNLLYLIF